MRVLIGLKSSWRLTGEILHSYFMVPSYGQQANKKTTKNVTTNFIVILGKHGKTYESMRRHKDCSDSFLLATGRQPGVFFGKF